MLKSQTSQIIFAIVLMLLSSVIFLFWIENTQHSYSYNKSWWTISFIEPNPVSANLDFEIENYTSTNKFTYIIKNDSDITILKENLLIPKNSKKIVSIKKIQNDRTIVEVLHEKDIKTLTK